MPAKDLSQLGKLFFDEGAIDYFSTKKGSEKRVDQQLLFYPCIKIDSYSESRNKKRIFKHIIYDIYDITFKAIAKYQHNDQPSGYYKFKDLNHYLIEVTPGFSAFHFNWTKVSDKSLQIGTLYRGYCRLTTCFNPATENPNIDAKAIKRIRCKGVLEEIQINKIWRDYEKQVPTPKSMGRDTTCKESGVICYDDALESIGYPRNELKFKVKVSENEQVVR